MQGKDANLKEQAALYRALVEGSIQGVVIGLMDPLCLPVANAAMADLTGYASDELMAMGAEELTALIHPEDRKRFFDNFRRRLCGEEVQQRNTYRLMRRDGQVCWVDGFSNRIVYRGKPAVMATFVDVTDQHEAQQALQAREAQWRSYIDNAPYGVFVADREGRYCDVNPAASRITGYSREELLAMGVPDLLPLHARGAGAAHFRRLLRHGRASGVFPFVHHDGAEREWSVSAVALDHNRFLGFVEDVTTQRRAQRDLFSSERKFARVFDAAPMLMTISSIEDGRYIEVNDAFVEATGYTREATIGRTSTEIGFIAPEVRDILRADLASQGFVRGRQLTLRRASGEEMVCRYSGEIIDIEGVPHLLSIAMDITAELGLENQLRHAMKMEAVGRLAGGVAHDYNNIIMGIMNYADLCRDGVETDHPIRKWIDEITQEAERSARLTHQLLAFARKQTVQPRIVDLNDAVTHMLTMMRRLIGEHIRLTWMPCDNIWPIRIDPGQVDQIMANLCVNARDAIRESGHVGVKTRNVTIGSGKTDDALAPGDYVCLTVEDDGCGMDRETLGHVFEPFFTTKGLGQGTGLGMATVYGIVKQNDGDVSIESAPGAGTTVSIYLPRREPEAPSRLRESRPQSDEMPGGSETILLVEDEKSVRETMAYFLERLGYTVLSAELPQQAIDIADSEACNIDLLVTDVVMPGMSGHKLDEHLRATRPGLSCIYISGYTADVIAHRGLVREDVDFLPKPASRRSLAEKIREVLDRDASRSQST